MRRIVPVIFLVSLALAGNETAFSQTAWFHRWGLLPENTLDLFIREASGERAYNTIFDLSEPLRKRTSEEFSSLFYESKYITGKLEEYGLTDVTTERLGRTKIWHPLKGELTEISPGKSVIADNDDIPYVLHPISTVTETDGELVYIGDASSAIIDPLDLRGKIVLTSARPDRLIQIFLQKEVVGVISFYTSRRHNDSLMIDDRKIENLEREFKSNLFVFKISPRDGIILRNRLQKGEKIVLHASVRYRIEDAEIQVPTCLIQGTDPEAGEIIYSAHLFEGYGVQGANDNLSGSAVILETARILSRLISEGKISRPLRSIRFIWVPEYSGSIPWVGRNIDEVKTSLCNINLDMVGLSLSRFKSYFVLHRTSYGNAHYVNDVVENYYRYVSENNQENSVIAGDKFFKPIVAPTGTDDPFYFVPPTGLKDPFNIIAPTGTADPFYNLIEMPSGGSDHDIFNDWGVGVPGVLMITWPDPYYHTSKDRADNIDPTQLKRVAFISAAAGYTIADAGDNEALAIAGEVYGNAVRRLGYQISAASDEINKADADTLQDMLRLCIARIKGTAIGEAMTLSSVSELSPSNPVLTNMINTMSKSLTEMATASSNTITAQAEYLASIFGMDRLAVNPTSDERRAAEMVPKLTESRKGKGYEYLTHKLNNLPVEVKNKYPIEGFLDFDEAARCINGKNSVLDIKYLLDAQRNDVTSIDDLKNLFWMMEAAGLVKL